MIVFLILVLFFCELEQMIYFRGGINSCLFPLKMYMQLFHMWGHMTETVLLCILNTISSV